MESEEVGELRGGAVNAGESSGAREGISLYSSAVCGRSSYDAVMIVWMRDSGSRQAGMEAKSSVTQCKESWRPAATSAPLTPATRGAEVLLLVM